MKKLRNKKPNISHLQAIAEPAWPTPRIGSPPPTVEHLVECLKNVAVNRLHRIRELEGHIHRLCELNRPQ